MRRTAFGRLVRDALAHLHDLPYLQTHALGLLGPDRSHHQRQNGQAIQDVLIEAIEVLRPPPGAPDHALAKAVRRYELVRQRYVEGRGVQEICLAIGVSQSEYYREHVHGVEAIIAFLLAGRFSVGEGRAIDALLTPSGALSAPAPTHLNVLSPLVGRAEELSLLKATYETMSAGGEARLVFLTGEAGVGKTRLVQELRLYVRYRAGCFLEGRYLRDAPTVYGPWGDITRSAVQLLAPDEIRRMLGRSAASLAQLIPEFAAYAEDGDGAAWAEEQRVRLLDGIAGALGCAALRAPTVILVDDLHWAPRLGVLSHIVHRLRRHRVMFVGTYRPLEFGETQYLPQDLTELFRTEAPQRLQVGRLSHDHTAQMVANIFGQVNAAKLSAEVYRATNGNPFFVEETLRSLVDRQIAVPTAQGWEITGTGGVSIPESVKLVVDDRINRMGAKVRELLTMAAVLGNEFTLAVIATACEMDDVQAWEVIDRASGGGVLEDRSASGEERYAFVGDHVREVLLEGLSPTQHRHAHVKAARALEAVYAPETHTVAAELGEHFSFSLEAADLHKAVAYSTLAAGQALELHAYVTATRHMERALTVQQRVNPEDAAQRCSLLLALGEILGPGGEPLRVASEIAEEALLLAEALGDDAKAAHACRLAFEAMFRYGAGTAPSLPIYHQWAERISRHAAAGTVDQIYAEIAMSWIKWRQRRLDEARQGLLRALSHARALDDAQALFYAAAPLLMIPPAPQHLDEQLALASAIVREPRTSVSLRSAATALLRGGCVFLQFRQRERAATLWREVDELAERTQDAYLRLYRFTTEATWRLLQGQLASCIETCHQLMSLSDASGMPVVGRQMAAVLSFRPYLFLGRADEALAFLARHSRPADAAVEYELPLLGGYSVLGLAHAGEAAKAAHALEQVFSDPDFGIETHQAPAYLLVMLLEAAVLIGHQERAARLARELSSAAGLFLSSAGYTCVARHLGSAAELSGEPEAAEAHYRVALTSCESMQHLPELALVQLQYARLLAAWRPDRGSEAASLMEQAAPALRRMGMNPANVAAKAVSESSRRTGHRAAVGRSRTSG